MSKLRITVLPFENLWKFAFQPIGFQYCLLKGLEPEEDVSILWQFVKDSFSLSSPNRPP